MLEDDFQPAVEPGQLPGPPATPQEGLERLERENDQTNMERSPASSKLLMNLAVQSQTNTNRQLANLHEMLDQETSKHVSFGKDAETESDIMTSLRNQQVCHRLPPSLPRRGGAHLAMYTAMYTGTCYVHLGRQPRDRPRRPRHNRRRRRSGKAQAPRPRERERERESEKLWPPPPGQPAPPSYRRTGCGGPGRCRRRRQRQRCPLLPAAAY
eukprot:SAG22_NODE_728_length_7596_cov_342.279178_3_plen_212_part_00